MVYISYMELFMKTSKLLIVTMFLFVTLLLYACAPVPHGGHGGNGVAEVVGHILTPVQK